MKFIKSWTNPTKTTNPIYHFVSTNLLISHTPNLNLELTNPAESNHQHTNNKRRKALINQLTDTSSEHSGAAAAAAASALSDSRSLRFGFVSFFLLDLLLFFFLDWILMRFWAGLIRTISRTGLFFFFFLFYLLLLLLLLFTIYYLFILKF